MRNLLHHIYIAKVGRLIGCYFFFTRSWWQSYKNQWMMALISVLCWFHFLSVYERVFVFHNKSIKTSVQSYSESTADIETFKLRFEISSYSRVVNHIYMQSIAIKIASGQKPRACTQKARALRKYSLWAGRNLQQDQTHMGTDSSTVAVDLQETGLHLFVFFFPSPSPLLGMCFCWFWWRRVFLRRLTVLVNWRLQAQSLNRL